MRKTSASKSAEQDVIFIAHNGLNLGKLGVGDKLIGLVQSAILHVFTLCSEHCMYKHIHIHTAILS